MIVRGVMIGDKLRYNNFKRMCSTQYQVSKEPVFVVADLSELLARAYFH